MISMQEKILKVASTPPVLEPGFMLANAKSVWLPDLSANLENGLQDSREEGDFLCETT